jgi:phosphoenolpyruvate carboxylase
MPNDEEIRQEIDQLGRMFGEVVRHFQGDQAFDLIERVRHLARQFTRGDRAAGDELNGILRSLSLEQLRIVTRAFSTFLELANLAEDRQRVRILRSREAQAYPQPYKESIQAAIVALRERGMTATEVQQVLRRVRAELVFTAHPTEAKRRSLRSKMRAIRGLMGELDSRQLLPAEEKFLRSQLRGELSKLWKTDFIRPSRPTVSLEVYRGLSFQPVLWATVPKIFRELREAVSANFPDSDVEYSHVLSFGSWMGGDRDGHPFVTPQITAQTCQWLRLAALETHLEVRSQLADSLSISRRQSPACEQVEVQIEAACQRWPELVYEVSQHGEQESYRRWLRVIRWRLERTSIVGLAGPPPDGAYASAEEFSADVEIIRRVLVADGNPEVAENEVQTWLDQIAVFGFHTARLDIRQHSVVYRDVINELWRAAGIVADAAALDEAKRQRLLADTLDSAATVRPKDLSAKAKETLDLFQTIRRVARSFGMRALGGHVVSMTHQPSDLLTVLWFWKWSEQTDGGHPADAELRLPIIPLFETISDLKRAPQILSGLLDTPSYRDWVRAQGDKQTVMIGYSDSTKDGGYLAACWALQRGQEELFQIARERGVHVTFFHGRGGSLGRGGGPAARAILSLPSAAFDGSLRLTEQGEILAERYDDAHIAYRHLEQVIWSVLTASTRSADHIQDQWRTRMDQFAEVSYRAYRKLVDHKSFGNFFRHATPITDIESLHIASRPARRTASDRIEDLRAIPWVFAWTQSRCLLPAWYGVGTAFGELLDSAPQSIEELRTMYGSWPFFRAMIDNAVLAVAKSSRLVFEHYGQLTQMDPGCREILAEIDREWERTDAALRAVTGCEELLDDVPWLKRSIIVRNGYVDPLNLIQAELQTRGETGKPPSEELAHLRHLVVKGIAAGMRTTG